MVDRLGSRAVAESLRSRATDDFIRIMSLESRYASCTNPDCSVPGDAAAAAINDGL